MRVLVTGATGTLGSRVVPVLRDGGHTVIAMSRRSGCGDAVTWRQADLATGTGLDDAVDGVDVVVHLASSPYRRGYTHRVDVDGTARLVEACDAAGVGHVLFVSIVGLDQIPWKYFGQKLAAEHHVRGGRSPWSIVRATQFYPSVDKILRGASRLPVMPVPAKTPGQPVDPLVVAERLLDCVGNGPSSDIVEVGGPEVMTFTTMTRTWLELRNRRRGTFPVKVPGQLGEAFRAGRLNTKDGHGHGRTWREWLQEN